MFYKYVGTPLTRKELIAYRSDGALTMTSVIATDEPCAFRNITLPGLRHSHCSSR